MFTSTVILHNRVAADIQDRKKQKKTRMGDKKKRRGEIKKRNGRVGIAKVGGEVK